MKLFGTMSLLLTSLKSTNLQRSLMDQLPRLSKIGRLVHWPQAAADSPAGRRSARPFLFVFLVALVAPAPMAFSQEFISPYIVATVEPAGMVVKGPQGLRALFETSPLIGNPDVFVEDFNRFVPPNQN